MTLEAHTAESGLSPTFPAEATGLPRVSETNISREMLQQQIASLFGDIGSGKGTDPGALLQQLTGLVQQYESLEDTSGQSTTDVVPVSALVESTSEVDAPVDAQEVVVRADWQELLWSTIPLSEDGYQQLKAALQTEVFDTSRYNHELQEEEIERLFNTVMASYDAHEEAGRLASGKQLNLMEKAKRWRYTRRVKRNEKLLRRGGIPNDHVSILAWQLSAYADFAKLTKYFDEADRSLECLARMMHILNQAESEGQVDLIQPNFYFLSIESKESRKKSRRRFLVGTGVTAAAAAAYAGSRMLSKVEGAANTAVLRPVVDKEAVFAGSYGSEVPPQLLHPVGGTEILRPEPSAETAEINPALEDTPTVSETEVVQDLEIPEQEAESASEEVRIGDDNVVEYLFGEVASILYQARQERAARDPGFAERVSERMREMPEINFLLMGIDQARWRTQSWENYGEKGYGNNDVSLIMSVNPHTLEITVSSFPRDLYSPEMRDYRYDNGRDPIKSDVPVRRINAVTAHSTMDQSTQLSYAHQVFESATGLPLDGVMRCNMDFAMEALSALCPDGLEIDVPQDIEITYLYGSDTVRHHWPQGKQRLQGMDLVAYARTRKDASGNDDTRGEKQRQVALAFAKDFGQRIVSDLLSQRLDSLHLLAEVLAQQQSERGNLASSLAIDSILEAAVTNMEGLLNHPNAINILTLLGMNTASDLRPDRFRSVGIGDMCVLDEPERPLVLRVTALQNPTQEEAHVQKVDYGLRYLNGSRLDPGISGQGRTQHGNYLGYWQPLRAHFERLFIREAVSPASSR